MDHSDAVMREVARALPNASALPEVPALRASMARRRAALETQLSSAVQTHADEGRRGLALLDASFATIREVREHLEALGALWRESETLLGASGTIKEVSVARTNLTGTMGDLELIATLSARVEFVQSLLQDDDNMLDAAREIDSLVWGRDALLRKAEAAARSGIADDNGCVASLVLFLVFVFVCLRTGGWD
jgi:hypothetical protein